ncbi:MAG: futalosine hydrolase [Flavitalea sp.]
MQILLTSATDSEISATTQWLKGLKENKNISCAVTGIGSAITAYTLTKIVRGLNPGLVIQAGIAGTYSESFPPGSTVIIQEDGFADLGALENHEFTDVFDLGLISTNETPFSNKFLFNPHLDQFKKYDLPYVRGATVNCISSSPEQVAMLIDKYNPVVESMEGAALHYVCLMENIPFLQLRSISNFAGERNKQHWKIKEAVQNLNNELKRILLDY